MNRYDNGPLPGFLARRAPRSPSGDEFALHAEDALAYLDWCDENALTVIGFDVWAMREQQLLALPHLDESGDSDHCRTAIKSIEADHAEEIVARHGVPPNYNIWVRRRTE